MTSIRHRAGLALLVLVASATSPIAVADEVGSAASAGGAAPNARWGFQIKRQATERGTSDESTRTQLRFESFPDGEINRLRLDIPFPDEKTEFSGSPFEPRLGDIKARVGWRAVEVLSRPWTSFVEVTFPTADPAELGSGKYQVGAGIRTAAPLSAADPATAVFRQTVEFQFQQVLSVAGDEDRTDINQTKLEFEWRGTRPSGRSLKATAKPVIDWVRDGNTGAVGELEAGMPLDAAWSLALMGGVRLWGDGVAGTYGKRLEVKLNGRF